MKQNFNPTNWIITAALSQYGNSDLLETYCDPIDCATSAQSEYSPINRRPNQPSRLIPLLHPALMDDSPHHKARKVEILRRGRAPLRDRFRVGSVHRTPAASAAVRSR